MPDDVLDSQTLPVDGDPLGGEEPEPASNGDAPPEAPADPPAAEDGQGEDAPDLSEQETALATKLGPVVAEHLARTMRGEDEPSGLQSVLDPPAGDPEEPYVPDDGYDYGQEQGEPDQELVERIQSDPVVAAIVENQQATQQQLDTVLGHLQQTQQASNDAQLGSLAEKYSDLDTEDALAEVERRLSTADARGLDRRDPFIVEQVLQAVRSERAAPAEVPADEARNQGATLETNAGAAVDSSQSPEDQWWGQIMGAGGSDPFA